MVGVVARTAAFWFKVAKRNEPESSTMKKTTSFQSVMSDLEDPRQQSKVVYPLHEILLLCLCGVISGCESFTDIAEYGKRKLEFLRRLSDFANGTPSHDTMSTVLRALDPEAFGKAFARWAAEVCGDLGGRTVAADGKTTVKTRYFIPSLPLDAGRFAYAERSHWGIGNRQHRVSAVTFRDDDSRVRKDGAPKNFAVMKHMAMNLPTGRRSANPYG